MSEYTVYRMVAIKVEADSRKEAINNTNIQMWCLHKKELGSVSRLGKGQLISAVKTKENR